MGNIAAAESHKMGSRTISFYSVEDVKALGQRIRPGGVAGKGRPRKADQKPDAKDEKKGGTKGKK